MSYGQNEEGDRRRPQGAWPLIIFLSGLAAVGLYLLPPKSGAINSAAVGSAAGVVAGAAAGAANTVVAASESAAGDTVATIDRAVTDTASAADEAAANAAKTVGAATSAAAGAIDTGVSTVASGLAGAANAAGDMVVNAAPASLNEKLPRILMALGDAPNAGVCQGALVGVMKDQEIKFNYGSSALSPEAMSTIEAASKVAAKCASHMIEVAGHTDRVGTARANMRLSRLRAVAVKDYLVNKGVPADRIIAKGFGETRPLRGVKDIENRRIEFRISATS